MSADRRRAARQSRHSPAGAQMDDDHSQRRDHQRPITGGPLLHQPRSGRVRISAEEAEELAARLGGSLEDAIKR